MSRLMDALRKAEAARDQLRKHAPQAPTQRLEQDQLAAGAAERVAADVAARDLAEARAAADRDAAQAVAQRFEQADHAAQAARAHAKAAGAPGPAASPLVALGLALAVFVGAVSAWHAQPWRPPPSAMQKLPALKLDYRLDLQRNSHRLTGSAGTPPQ